MKAEIEKSSLNGSVRAIQSKSFFHRIAICHYLATGTVISADENNLSEDIKATIHCLNSLKNGEKLLDAGESGSTLRFMLALCAVKGGVRQFTGHGKLMQRPNDALFSVFNQHGVKTYKNKHIVIDGKLTSGDYIIRGDISSQYISALLMALPLLDGDSRIILSSPLCSAPYVEITREVLRHYNIDTEQKDYGYFIKGNQKYNVLTPYYAPEGDWSNMASLLVAGTLCGDIKVYGLNVNSVQGDRVIVKLLKEMGADVEICDNYIKAKKSDLKSIVCDAENFPDLVPCIAVCASVAKGVTRIKNVDRLRLKESDRIESTMKMLNSFHIKSEYKNGELIVYGGVPSAGVVDAFNDHRIVMASSVLALVCQGITTINGAEAVCKSYPDFFNVLCSTGGKVNVNI